MSRPKVIDLFAGVGGLSLGFEQAGYDVAAAVEFDPVHMAAHEFNFPRTASISRDVLELTGDYILNAAGITSDEVHTVVGGAPCQGFSMMGKRALDDPRNELVAEFARLVFEIQPRYFVLENVAGLATGKHKKFLNEVIEYFEAHGYSVLEPVQILQAANFGVGQSRRRLFLIGAREGIQLPTYPQVTTAARNINGTLSDSLPVLPLCPSVSELLDDIPNAEDFEELLESDSVAATFMEPQSNFAAQLRGLIPADHYGYARHFDPDILTSSARTVHTAKSIERFEKVECGTTDSVSRFLRLHPDGICNTLRAGTASDRGAHTSPRPLHHKYPRVITVREAARLHGYPDWFRFHVTKWHGFRQIGNSVPPRLGQAVAGAILSADKITPVKPTEVLTPGSENLLKMNATEAEAYFGITERVIPQRKRKDSNGKEE